MQKPTVLTIDDEFLLRQSIVAYLEDSGFTVYEAENGEQGLEVFTKYKPDLVLTDIQMPGIKGLDILSKIHDMSPDTPVIVVSGMGDMNDVIEALRGGAWDYITKPITDLAILEHAILSSHERFLLIEQNKLYSSKLERNLSILEEDHKAARGVQNSLLPPTFLDLKGYKLSHLMVPSLYLSGDFIDFFNIDEQLIGFYLADVSGHGASSAFITILLKSLIEEKKNRYIAKDNNDTDLINPSALFSYLNKVLFKAKLGKYLTMIYGVINTATGECTYCISGHYPSPILVTNNAAHYVSGEGFPIGIVETAKYIENKFVFNAQDNLMLFSDGIMEILCKDKNMLEKDTLLLDIAAKANGDIAKIVEICNIETDSNNNPDDISILSIIKS